MLADAVEEGVKSSPPQTRRGAAPARGLPERVRGWVFFNAIDGRSASRARLNAPFDPRGALGFVLVTLIRALPCCLRPR